MSDQLEQWAITPSAVWDGQSLLKDKAVIIEGEYISAIVDIGSLKDISRISNVKFVTHRGRKIHLAHLTAMRDSEFLLQPTDAISEMIDGVANTKQLPKSPPVVFKDLLKSKESNI